MSRDSETDDEHYEEESMMSHIDYDDSMSMDDLAEHYTDYGSPSMEDMEHNNDNGSSSMKDMVEHYIDYDSPSTEDLEIYISRMESEAFYAMQAEVHHQ